MASTGRTRRTSLTVASRYASSPSRMRASTSGWRASRSSAQPSEPAVVSWPAASSVASWSRSCSREAPVPLSTESSVPSAVVALDPLVEQGVERADAAQVGRVRAVPAAPQAHGQQHRHRHLQRAADRVAQPRVAAAEDDAQDDLERHRLHALERLDRPAGLPAAPALPRATRAIVSRQRWSSSPWKGGSMSLRSFRCSSPSSTRIERGPANGSRKAELAPARSSSGGAA